MLSPLLLLLAALLRPSQARCPRGTWLDEGVRSSGEYRCAPIDGEGMTFVGRVYCPSGRAATDDGVSVRCAAKVASR